MKNRIKHIIGFCLLLVTFFLTYQLIFLARQNLVLKTDLSQINHIQYGLLNINEWEEKLVVVVSEKIDEFELTDNNQVKLQASIEIVLYKLIDEVEVMMEERTEGGFTRVKKWAANLALDVEQLRDSVPALSVMILEEVNKPETKSKLKGLLVGKLNEFAQSTYNEDDMILFENLLQKYDCNDKTSCQAVLEAEVKNKQAAVKLRVWLISILVLSIFLIGFSIKGKPNKLQVLMLILASLSLLLGGITTPMIDIEARIDSLVFKLMGKEIVFTDQIIFFQSKSITDVVNILISDGALQMIFVGILIFMFSIVFPTLKLISTYLYSLNITYLRKNIFIRFFVLKSGKWSMADVMVVAMFMAYIGFNGIVSSQLHTMSVKAEPVKLLTTNGTELLGGFYLFLFFCISSLVLSDFIVRRTKTQ